MTDCWAVLGLEPDVDGRAVKRRYAALLRETRPDEDPQGFQQLRTAYEEALEAISNGSPPQRLRHQEWPQPDEGRPTAVPLEAQAAEEEPWPSDESESQRDFPELQKVVRGELETPIPSGSSAGERAAQILAELIPQSPAQALDESERQDCRESYERQLIGYCLAGRAGWQPIAEWGMSALG